MAVGLLPPHDLLPVAGVRLAVTEAGIRHAGRRDLTLIAADEGTQVAGVFTRNRFSAAPVVVAQRHLSSGTPIRALVINTGNANAGTGAAGLQAAEDACRVVAVALDCPPESVLPFSTGVIGEPVDLAGKISAALPALKIHLDENHWEIAAAAIMTTDTIPKACSRQIDLDGQKVTVTGMAKGSGMIRPDMATMLAYMATDAPLQGEALQQCLQDAMAQSFNRITVDGDTSTNDACILIATGKIAAEPISRVEDSRYAPLCSVITEVAQFLAQAIVRDGEGASKFIPIQIAGGRNEEECLQVAYRMAHSPLIKTAFFASDPNWGRLLAAIGSAGVDDLEVDKVQVSLGETRIVRDGARDPDYTEAAGQAVMAEAEIPVRVDLGRGLASATIWTCDLSYDYVRINADYRS
ncbi:bifunctional glutamate N-acetyltransferase/amino-acid acetyltransferase ArgJ [Acidithiobacillus thiooxidans]|uniref:Arginine biosynthesis bifunctional protein ArgJ n=2 Tax=Acidithiobacillus TaxID=119977 RepID=A0A1C2I8F8_ACITH|nr:bifunctional glutamate N-acetyltransferase/amino-acid acetyltransferase ArgJ [Acidithiobacillus thiooxidans]MBU2838149.1 bifunctional glutamate N-acetyltransferase/amino-acid acetyltransferase ArgJ [Acidithiobacillus thiooxidans]OCX69995.1 bifunctional ornithine acetyltransferase/N-acetylglutamate synthase [Acidithiobacillus thiooxidans]OCX72258.1 bifunctional ornithine acetyltransferase/N-acetylglutamate synthase [Acidithiobacillus thiooxidans]OCX75235.1 bifunctional ornithine acetyltransfe